jgi:hypothetical protein
MTTSRIVDVRSVLVIALGLLAGCATVAVVVGLAFASQARDWLDFPFTGVP